MDAMRLPVRERKQTGSGPARRLRAQGVIPGVIYGRQGTALSVGVRLENMKAVLAHGHNILLELDFEEESDTRARGAKTKKGARRYAVIKELQFHPVKGHILHVDLHEVDLAAEIEALVPVEAVGTPAGLTQGGVLEWEKREVSVRALPSSMPASLMVDVSSLGVGQHLTVAALAVPEGVTVLDDPEGVLVAVLPPRVQEGSVSEAGETAEPEMAGGGSRSSQDD